MEQIDTSAKTVEEAVIEGLKKLGVVREDVNIEILDRGGKGMFGLGGHDARVRLKLKNDVVEYIKGFLDRLFSQTKLDTQYKVEEDEANQTYEIKIDSSDKGLMIGRKGETLDALQYIITTALNKKFKKRVRVNVDVNNYRKKLDENLKRSARQLAQKVKLTRKESRMEPMNPRNRRIVHITIRDIPGVETESRGTGLLKTLWVKPVNNGKTDVPGEPDGNKLKNPSEFQDVNGNI